jgi:hypothetical protein
MPMVPFHEFYEDVSRKETRFIIAPHGDGPLPEGEYGLFESYCNEPGCDCRRVFINVMSRSGHVATIGFGWEDVEFYRKWMHQPDGDEMTDALAGAQLEPMQRQSRWADAALKLVTENVLSDHEYVERVRRHYRMVRDKVDAAKVQRSTRGAGGAGRNAACPCGSGKKYKRCCGREQAC